MSLTSSIMGLMQAPEEGMDATWEAIVGAGAAIAAGAESAGKGVARAGRWGGRVGKSGGGTVARAGQHGRTGAESAMSPANIGPQPVQPTPSTPAKTGPTTPEEQNYARWLLMKHQQSMDAQAAGETLPKMGSYASGTYRHPGMVASAAKTGGQIRTLMQLGRMGASLGAAGNAPTNAQPVSYDSSRGTTQQQQGGLFDNPAYEGALAYAPPGAEMHDPGFGSVSPEAVPEESSARATGRALAAGETETGGRFPMPDPTVHTPIYHTRQGTNEPKDETTDPYVPPDRAWYQNPALVGGLTGLGTLMGGGNPIQALMRGTSAYAGLKKQAKWYDYLDEELAGAEQGSQRYEDLIVAREGGQALRTRTSGAVQASTRETMALREYLRGLPAEQREDVVVDIMDNPILFSRYTRSPRGETGPQHKAWIDEFMGWAHPGGPVTAGATGAPATPPPGSDIRDRMDRKYGVQQAGP